MASLSNINGLFDVHSTGAILFSTSHGTSGQILRSNGNAAPTWVDASTVIGGPYLPLTGGTLTGATATATGISFTVGGALTGTSATFEGVVFANGEGNGFLLDAATAATARTGFMKYGGTEGQIISGNNTKIRLTHRTDSDYVYGGTPTIREDLVISASGNVGIAETDPDDLLHITSPSWAFRIQSSVNDNYLRMSENQIAAFNSSGGGSAFYINNSSTGNIYMAGGGGNIGVGTLSPNNLLNLSRNVANGDVATYIQNSNADTGSTNETASVKFAHGNDAVVGYVGAKIVCGKEGDFETSIANVKGFLSFYTASGTSLDSDVNNIERMRIGGDGNVSIGAGTGGARNARLLLDNVGSQGTPQLMLIDSDDSGKQSEIRFDSGNLIFDYWGGTSRSEYLRIKSDGDVGINVTNPLFKLDIADDVTGVVLQLKSSSTSGAGLYINNNRTGSKKFGLLVGNVAAGAFSIKDEDAGLNRLVIDSSGNIGVGTDDPSGASGTTIAINGGAGQARLAIKNDATGDGSDDGFQIGIGTGGEVFIEQREDNSMQFTTNNLERIKIDNSGYVNIKQKQNSGLGYDLLINIGTSPDGKIGYQTQDQLAANLAVNANSNWIKTGNNIYNSNSANVGIGTTDPTNGKLEIQQTATTAALWVQTGGTTNSYSVADFRTGTNLSALRINGDGNSLFGGNIGINSTSPNVKLQVNATGGNISSGNAINLSTMKGIKLTNTLNDNSSVGLWFGTNNVHWSGISGQRNNYTSTWGTDLRFYTHEDATTDLTYSRERMRITSEGFVGINNTSPTYRFHVKSSNNVSIFEDTSNSSGASFIVFNRPGVFAMGSITRNGSANSVSYNTGSDYRLKEDLKDFNALDLVNNITAYDYKWKNVDQRDYGFIAHELEKTLPNVVTGEKDGEKMQGVDYSKLTPILLKAIQELEARVKELENK